VEYMSSKVRFRIIRRAILHPVLVLLVLLTSMLSIQLFILNASSAAGPAYAPYRSVSPTDIPAAPSSSDRVVVSLVTEELLGQLADGVTYMYWTFNGTVPGPLIRLREGQVVELHIRNASNSTMTHSIDSHAILGTGGGSVYTQTPPGQESVFQFTAMRAGLYVYHCATPDIPTHIANGMYGLMLVEPRGGLPKADREFYVMQGEFYTQGAFGEQGYQAFSYAKANAETPEYVVFNGRVGSLDGGRIPKVKVGETVRIFFGNGGPNLISSFHVIGGIFDRVYPEGALVSPPIQNVQTTLVPAGGSVMVELKAEIPGRWILVDHSLFRIHRGAIGTIDVEGQPNSLLYSSIKNATSGTQGDSHMTNMTTTQTTTTATGIVGQTDNVEVLIENYAYIPAEITITAGTTVTWINKDPVGHTVTEGVPESPKPANQRLFDSANAAQGEYDVMLQGQSWSFTFTTPGTYHYYCLPHPYMKGRVIVLPAAGAGIGQQGTQGYGDFTVLLTGQQIYAISSFGLVVLVALMAVFAKTTKRAS